MRKAGAWWVWLIFLGINSSVFAQNVDDALSIKVDTGSRSNLLKKAILPAALITYGLISLENKPLQQFDRYVSGSMLNKPSFSNVDDYLRYAPIGAVYGLSAIHVKSKNSFADRTILLLISTAITSGSVTLTKQWSRRLRPDGSNKHSFPSGHTGTAFMSAEFMHQEYGDQSVWYSIGGYTAASFTGAIRLFRHAHWFSDVVAAAGFGILSTKLAYLIYPYIKEIFSSTEQANLLIIPSFQDDFKGLTMSYSFR